MGRESANQRGFRFAKRTSSLPAEDVEKHQDMEEKAPSATQEDKDDKEEEDEVRGPMLFSSKMRILSQDKHQTSQYTHTITVNMGVFQWPMYADIPKHVHGLVGPV